MRSWSIIQEPFDDRVSNIFEWLLQINFSFTEVLIIKEYFRVKFGIKLENKNIHPIAAVIIKIMYNKIDTRLIKYDFNQNTLLFKLRNIATL